MKNNFVLKQILNILILIACTTIVMYFFLRNYDFGKLVEATKSASMFWLSMVLACMVGFVACEACVIKLTMKALGKSFSLARGMEYSFAGFFFSSITPSSSGGQPMQVYYMAKDKIDPSSSIVCLLVVIAEYQVAMVTFASLLSIFHFRTAISGSANLKYLLTFGGIANVAAAIVFIMLLFSGNVALKIAGTVLGFLNRIGIMSLVRMEKWSHKSEELIHKYSNSAKLLRNNKTLFIKGLIISLTQMVFYCSVTYCVYRAVGQTGHSWGEITTLQSLLMVGSSAVPLPGSVGAAEGGFLHIFRPIFDGDLLQTSMILQRGISFYMFTVLSMLVCLYLHLRTSKLIDLKRV